MNQVTDILEKRLKKEDRILFAFIHGSFVEGRGFRDIDVAVMLIDGVPATETELELETEISRDLSLPAPLDLRSLNRAPLPFMYSVLARGHLLFTRSEDALAEFRERTYRNYLDCRYLYDRYLEDRSA
jgi:hypothetical protein